MISDFANHNGFTLRKFTPKDTEILINLGSPTCAFMHARESAGEGTIRKNFAAFVKDYACEPESEIYIVETADKQVAAQLWLHVTQNRFNGISECWIWDLTVQEAYRQKGLGRALLTFAKERAISHCCKELWLLVSSRNDKAIHLYQASELSEKAHLMSVSLDFNQ